MLRVTKELRGSQKKLLAQKRHSSPAVCLFESAFFQDIPGQSSLKIRGLMNMCVSRLISLIPFVRSHGFGLNKPSSPHAQLKSYKSQHLSREEVSAVRERTQVAYGTGSEIGMKGPVGTGRGKTGQVTHHHFFIER